MTKVIFSALIGLTLLAGPAAAHGHGDHGAMTPIPIGSMQVSDMRVPEAPPGGNGAAYLTLTNHGAADRLVGVTSDLAEAAEIHSMETKDGIMEMRKLDGLDVPAGGTVELKPGGLHIMLIKPTGLKAGTSGTVTLVFEVAGEVAIPVKVTGRDAGGGHDHH